jgi:hypothetical protein
MTTGSLEASDQAAAAVQQPGHPRVTLDEIKANIASVEYVNPTCAPELTIAIVKHRNGFVVLGKSAPADPANFNAALGQKFALEDAIREFWPLEGFALRHRLAARP